MYTRICRYNNIADMIIKKETHNYNLINLQDLSIEQLIELYRNTNKPEVLDKIFEKSRKFVLKMANDLKNYSIEKEELQQLAFTGLLVAVNRFDPGKDNKFFTYAYYCIKGEILNHIRDNKIIKFPRWVWNLNKEFNDFMEKFQAENDRFPTTEEISRGINISIGGIDEILRIRESLYNIYSLDSGEHQDLDYDEGLIRSREQKSFNLPMEDKILLWNAMDRLKSLNKKVLIMKFFMGFSQKEIGDRIGFSQKHVSRKINEALKDLREIMLQ